MRWQSFQQFDFHSVGGSGVIEITPRPALPGRLSRAMAARPRG